MSRLVPLILAVALGAGAVVIVQSLMSEKTPVEGTDPNKVEDPKVQPMVKPVDPETDPQKTQDSNTNKEEESVVKPLIDDSNSKTKVEPSSFTPKENNEPKIEVIEKDPNTLKDDDPSFVKPNSVEIPNDAIKNEISLLVGAPPEKLELAAKKAEAALKSGDRSQAYRRYQELFRITKARRDISVAAIAQRYLELASTPEERLESLDYLVDREVLPSSIYRWAMKAGDLAMQLKGKENTQAAWSYLTRAYLNANSDTERKKVTDLLDPFLQKNIFDKGYSHLLTRHTVQPGESLALIAKRYQSTIDAIKYLNKLNSNVIQPRQGLLILSGKIELYVKKSEFRLWALVDNKLLFHAKVGLGKNDSTPVGKFIIAERVENPTWYPPGKEPIPAGNPENILGTRWLGFKDTEEHSGFGIHGTSDPSGGGIGKEVSLGCVRMLNKEIERIFYFIPYNTPITIRS